MPQGATDSVSDLKPGDHVCFLYDTEEQHRAVVTRFVSDGVEHNHRLFYLLDSHPRETILGYLGDAGLDAEDLAARGQLVFVDALEAYAPSGVLDPDALQAFMRRLADEAVADGYAAARATAEMTWIFRLPSPHEGLVEYCDSLNRCAPDLPCVTLCQYDARRFDAETLLGIVRAHPLLIWRGELVENVRYVPPEECDQLGSPAEILRRSLDGLAERHRVLARARANYEFTEAILDTAGVIVVVLDTEGRIVRLNRAGEQITGYSFEEVRGRPFWKIFLIPEEVDEVRDLIERICGGKPPSLHENFWVTRDGRRLWIQWSITTLAGPDGCVRNLVKVGIDRTLYHQAEELLRQAGRYNRSLLEASLDPLVTISPAGKITDANSAAAFITGHSRDELLGSDFSDYFTEPDKARASYERVFREGQVRDYLLEVIHRDGSTTPVLYNVSVYRDDNGEVAGVFAAARDVTVLRRQEHDILALNADLERRASDLALVNQNLGRANTDLKRVNEEMTAFAYSVSHDLSAPLVSLQGMAGLLLRDYRDKLGPEGVHRLERLQANVAKMEALVGDLLELSRIGRIGGHITDVDLVDAARQAVETLSDSLTAAGMEVVMGDGQVAQVRADSLRIHQVMANLIANAVKYAADVPDPRLEIAFDDSDPDEVRVSIADNGPGIPDEFRERIFHPFQRLPSSRSLPGTGMGLAIVRKIIEHHRGRIWVEAEPGGGSRFIFTLPRRGET